MVGLWRWVMVAIAATLCTVTWAVSPNHAAAPRI